jgi:ATP-dependent DNA helicase RecQ
VSEWGHDFRPDYRRLRAAAGRCRTSGERDDRPPIAAFTATATPEVRADIVALLGLESPQVLVAGFDRPNIFLRIEAVDDDLEKYELLPRLVRGRRALVYAATRRSTEGAAQTLKSAGVETAAYHAGLDDQERTRVQDAFANGSLRVVCATNAFGMGIDRPDVDAVVHFAIPGSVEAYYQRSAAPGAMVVRQPRRCCGTSRRVRARAGRQDPVRHRAGKPALRPAKDRGDAGR